MATYTLVPFNLEAMKISAYYKRKGEIVILSPEINLDKHQEIFYRKDYNDGVYPKELSNPIVKYGGYAFSGNQYISLPLEIEKMKPDTSLYSKMASVILNSSTQNGKKIFENMTNCEHCRISLNGKTIWQEYNSQFNSLSTARNLMLHDYNLNAIEGSFDLVKSILARARNDGWATKIGMKFPVIVNKGEDLLNWSSLNPNSTFYSLEFDGIIDNDTYIKFIGSYKNKSLYNQFDYYVNRGNYNEREFINYGIRQLLHQIIIARGYNVFYNIKYDKDVFFDKQWCDVLDLLNYYHTSYRNEGQDKFLKKVPDDTVYDFCANSKNILSPKYQGKAFTRHKIKEILNFVRERNYDLFKDFYECSFNTLGGTL